MKNYFEQRPDGFRESLERGMAAVRTFRGGPLQGRGARDENIKRLREEVQDAEGILIGAGAGLSASAGLIYGGERFQRYFFDFAKTYGIRDMYSGGFYPFPREEIRWAWWARHIYYNRYIDAPKPVYGELHALVRDRDYFVITTNVDHQFQRAGFDKKRLFYTQGDYGLFQSVNPRIRRTYDNEEWVMRAMEAQGFVMDEAGVFQVPPQGNILMEIPEELIPKCPDGGGAMTMNLRADGSFVEDEGWHRASAAYSDFLKNHEGHHMLYLELGVGANTPGIIKYPFWQMTYQNPKAVYACINYGEAVAPREIAEQSICIDGDIAAVLACLG